MPTVDPKTNPETGTTTDTEHGEAAAATPAPLVEQPTFFETFIDENRSRFIEIGQTLLAQLYHRADTPVEKADPSSSSPYLEGYDQLQLDDSNLYLALQCEAARIAGQPNGYIDWLRYLMSPAIIKAANRFVRGDVIHAGQRRNYLTAIVCMMWALNQAASEQDKVIERGSFKLLDPDGKLFDFLHHYVQFSTGQEMPGTLFSNDFAYARDPKFACSSHYKCDRDQFGIDVRFQGGDYALPLLPHQHTHILFGRVKIGGEYYTFVKFEEAGLGNVTEFLEHSLHFANSGTVDVTKTFREKDIPESLTGQYQNFCTAVGIEPIKKPSLHAMWAHIKQNITPDNADAQTARENFLAAADKFRLDHIDIRNGQEVIIDMRSFQQLFPAISAFFIRRPALSQPALVTEPIPRPLFHFGRDTSRRFLPFMGILPAFRSVADMRMLPRLPGATPMGTLPADSFTLNLIQQFFLNPAHLLVAAETADTNMLFSQPLALTEGDDSTQRLAVETTNTTVQLLGNEADFRLLFTQIRQSLQLFHQGHPLANELSVRSQVEIAPTLLMLAAALDQQRLAGQTSFRVAVTLPTPTVRHLTALLAGDRPVKTTFSMPTFSQITELPTELPVVTDRLAILPPATSNTVIVPSTPPVIVSNTQVDVPVAPAEPLRQPSEPLLVVHADKVDAPNLIKMPLSTPVETPEPSEAILLPEVMDPLSGPSSPRSSKLASPPPSEEPPVEPQRDASAPPRLELDAPEEKKKKSKYAALWIGILSVLSGFLAPISILGLYLYQSRIANKDTPKDWKYWTKAGAFSAVFALASLLTAFVLPIATLCWLKFSPKRMTPSTAGDRPIAASAAAPAHEDNALGEYHALLCDCFHLYTQKKPVSLDAPRPSVSDNVRPGANPQ